MLAQNLVRNPSFEIFANCPKKLGNMDNDVMDWTSPTDGSTDYFNGCSEVMGTPKNFNGEQPAHFGVAYVGFYFYAPEDYREYIQASLSQTLVKGKTYTISFYVSLAERSDFAVRELGVQFTENPVSIATKQNLSRKALSKVPGDKSNYFGIRYDDFYSEKEAWVLVEREFVAKGTENYLIIGNFNDNQQTQKLKTKRNVTKGSYYYVDMVSVQAGAAGMLSSERPKANLTFELDSVHTFNNVLFKFDTVELLEEPKLELDEITAYLNLHKHLKIEIRGHTDAMGSAAYNQKLSENRAKAVADYLLKNGIEGERIRFQGFGSQRPLRDNTTNAGRRINRRVEFRITL